MANGKVFMSDASQLDSDDPRPRYLCQRCGNCCRWPGDVRVTEEEVGRIARFLGLADTVFVERCTRLNANRTGLSIIDKPNGECLFLDGVNVCLIQPVKPGQCSGFPNDWNFPGWREKCEAIEVT
jgi:Fe-S-cluster containining protein